MRKIFNIPQIKLFRDDGEVINMIEERTLSVVPNFNNSVAGEMMNGEIRFISSESIAAIKVNNKIFKIPLKDMQ